MTASTAKTLLAIALSAAVLAGCGGRGDDAPVGPDEPLPEQAPEGQPAAPASATPDTDVARTSARPDEVSREARDRDVGGSGPAATPGAPGTDTADAGDTGDVPTATAAEVVYGRWTVTGHRLGAMSAVDENSANQLHGRHLAFAADRVESGADVCTSPRFAVREANVVEFLLTEFRSSPMDLGLQVAADSPVTVVDTDCLDQPWTTLGSRVLVLPDGSVLAPWDGAFFELSSGG